MTPQNKAKELYKNFKELLPDAVEIHHETIKGLCSFLVFEIKRQIDEHDEFEGGAQQFKYWNEVGQQINQL